MSPDWISALANLMMGLSAAVAGWAGIHGLNVWRTETVGRRKAKLAEEVLAQFYRARDVLTWARFPASDDEEEKARSEAGVNNDELERSEIFASVDRLAKESQVFPEFQASRYSFMTNYGEEVARPFEEIRSIQGEIIDSAHSLVRTYGQEAAGPEAL